MADGANTELVNSVKDDRHDIKHAIASISKGERYLNRELSWLQFNIRVLEEAQNNRHPLLERLRFLSISGDNLDEFYMVRVAGLRGQLALGVDVVSSDGLTPAMQLEKINVLAEKLLEKQQEVWALLNVEMRKAGMSVLEANELDETEQVWVKDYFFDNIMPLLTPIAVDPAHPFPFIPNLGFTIALSLKRQSDGEPMVALLPVPSHLKRFIRLPSTSSIRFISIERMIALFFDQLFPGYKIKGSGVFRVVRDSDIEIEEEAEDLVRVFESALKRRKRGRVIRLKVDADMPKHLRKIIVSRLNATDDVVVMVDGILGINETNQLIVDDNPDLIFKPYNPRYPERVKDFNGDIFKSIAAKDFVVHHPYESFEVVHLFLRQAARDPDVVAIKQTLYRAGSQSMIIGALIEAAEAGKSVTAVVELKARFDEEQNIKWARDLERAGVHVVFGSIELKTHGKVSMIVRRENGKLKSYMHFGTGNYHPITARIYTDLSFFTADQALARDANKMFNYLTGYVEPIGLEKLVLSPFDLRRHLVGLIEREIEFARDGKPAAIWVKLNSLLDSKIIDKLYEASQNGVQIDLIIRGICTLRPGLKGLSENIRVHSVIGRFLEHARICCFGNGHKLPSRHAKVYISSADWMPRNFNRRVETLVPIENPTVHDQIMGQVMAANLKDNCQTWLMDSDGNFSKREPAESDDLFSVHDYFMNNSSLSGRGSAGDGVQVAPVMAYGLDE
ncbi:RNA degradosome polyphosphate kinase [Kordiimonas aquimaris]|uniref:RNA degradosome polyphosphate kinase n=1 Tax=Kordiimonas aquimaris TaxID=707591 RepID=UPI0021CF038F|nr:RNA degradosome polyphosphate kinase [Kordiimonas aquimaris]